MPKLFRAEKNILNKPFNFVLSSIITFHQKVDYGKTETDFVQCLEEQETGSRREFMNLYEEQCETDVSKALGSLNNMEKDNEDIENGAIGELSNYMYDYSLQYRLLHFTSFHSTPFHFTSSVNKIFPGSTEYCPGTTVLSIVAPGLGIPLELPVVHRKIKHA